MKDKQVFMHSEWKANLPGVNIAHWLKKSHCQCTQILSREEQYITPSTLLYFFPCSEDGSSHLSMLDHWQDKVTLLPYAM